MSWFLPSGMVKLEPNDFIGRENTPLYHVTFLLRYNLFRESDIRLILDNLDFNDHRGEVSHDTMTGVYSYLVIAKEETTSDKLKREIDQAIKDLKILPKYDHPRDILYIGMLQNRWWWWAWLCLSPFVPILEFDWRWHLWDILEWTVFLTNPYLLFIYIFVYMAARKYKVRPHGTFFKTDTEILYWIRIQLPKRYFVIHMTKFITVPLLKRKYGEAWVLKMMELYYKYEDHPNRR